MLPFGVRSSAKISTALADTLEWIVRQRGVPHIAHYQDDFVMVGAPYSSQCADSLQTLTFAYKELGVPLVAGKCEGPTLRLTFLDIELDTVAWALRLPADKLTCTKEWNDRKACRRRARIPYWPPPARLQGCQAGTLIPSVHDKSAVRPIRLEGPPSSTPQQRFPGRSLLVEHHHIRLEWHRPHATLLEWNDRKACRRRELESLPASLQGCQAGTLVPSAHDKSAVRPIRLEGPLSSTPQQRFLR